MAVLFRDVHNRRLLVIAGSSIPPGPSAFEELLQKDQQVSRRVAMVGAHLAHRLVGGREGV